MMKDVDVVGCPEHYLMVVIESLYMMKVKVKAVIIIA
jgi:hypothetical protein